MSKEFFEALDEIAEEKGITTEMVEEAISAALLSAYKRSYNTDQNVRVEMDRENESVKVYLRRDVVEEVENEDTEISIEDALEIDPDYEVGDVMIIKDHISLFPNPLIGPNMADFGPRFPDMTCAYDLEMIALAEGIARETGIRYHKGVYFGSPGPTYETPAEVRFYRMAGADVVGMSTIPEVIVARHCGIRVFGMSVVTNKANFDNEPKNFNDGEDVVRAADAAADRMTNLFRILISKL